MSENNGVIPFIGVFHVGDEVTNGINEGKFVVTYVDTKNKAICGIGPKGQNFMEYMPTHWHPTGKTYEEAIALMNVIESD